MPRTVDHVAQRAEITDALVRVAAAYGLHTVTMRSVAAEARLSVRLVQYYFGTKADLMQAALLRLEEESQRWLMARLAALPDKATVRDLIDAFVLEALPTDRQSRRFHLVWTSYAMLAVNDPELAGHQIAGGPARAERQIADALDAARTTVELQGARSLA